MVQEAGKKGGGEAVRRKSTAHQGEIEMMEGSQLRHGWRCSCRGTKRESWRETEWRRFSKCPEMIAMGCIITLFDQCIQPDFPPPVKRLEWELCY